jgi:filamentous hemagglutinin family protein
MHPRLSPSPRCQAPYPSLKKGGKGIILVLAPLVAYSLFPPANTSAQAEDIVPDGTLPINSTVTRNGDTLSITDGSRVGNNLFHSFERFSVSTGQTAYFNNPLSVENIITRVTGGSISNIDGVIRANGNANLFLLNPNGISFGANATLKIGGSFFASTADAWEFADATVFSATDTATKPLLTISVPVGVQLVSPVGVITNAGNLETGKDLTLFSGSITSTGKLSAPNGLLKVTGVSGDVLVQNLMAKTGVLSARENLIFAPNLETSLQAKGDLSLIAGDTIKIQDSVANPFMVKAEGNLLLQGGKAIDIFILNHPQSGFVAQGDIVLRSPNSVIADSRYEAGGNFRIEEMDGSLGRLVSSQGTAIASFGDVSFGDYAGAFLRISAGGAVNIPGKVIILEPDITNTKIESRPTLDIRAGTNYEKLPPFPISSSNINVGEIAIIPPDGIVFLTNGYHPNLQLGDGTIQVGAINTRNNIGNGGDVFIDSRGEIKLTGDIDTSSTVARAGEISLQGGGDIMLGQILLNSNSTAGTGNIIVKSLGRFATNGTTISTATFGDAKAGDIKIDAQSVDLMFSLISTNTNNEATGQGGDITIKTNFFQGQSSSLEALTDGAGNAGKITIKAENDVYLDFFSAATTARPGASGRGNNLVLQARNLSLKNASALSAGTGGNGHGGNINIEVTDSINLSDFSTINSSVISGAVADAGDIYIQARSLSLTNGSVISTAVEGLQLFADETGNSILIPGGRGNAGNINIYLTETLSLQGQISPSDIQQGSLITSEIGLGAIGNGGDIALTTPIFSISNGALVSTKSDGTSSGGNAGDIRLTADNLFTLTGKKTGIFANTTPGSTGSGGNIFINAPITKINYGAGVFVNSFGDGSGGNLTLKAKNLTLNQGTLNAETSRGEGGNILIVAPNILQIRNNSQISATVNGIGNGGNITINAGFIVASFAENSDITANAMKGRGGNIQISTQAIFGLDKRSQITPLSDITASSQLGLNGNVSISTLNIEPSQGLVQLPSEVINATNQISQTCSAQARANSFAITGRGGLPPASKEVLNTAPGWVDWRFSHSWVGKMRSEDRKKGEWADEEEQSQIPHSPLILEATGWVINMDGKVELITAPDSEGFSSQKKGCGRVGV